MDGLGVPDGKKHKKVLLFNQSPPAPKNRTCVDVILEDLGLSIDESSKTSWVSTPLKNISQNGNLPQIGVKIKNV